MSDGQPMETVPLSGEALARQAESLWRRGLRPDPDRFLVAAGATTSQAIAGVLAVDQWQRWQSGERVSAEDYLERYPAIAADPRCALLLVYGEFLVREELEETPSPDEYLKRFPQYDGPLRLQFGFHAAVAGLDVTQPDGIPAPTKTGEPSSPVRPTLVIPGYELLEELGRGGMGVVYRARNLSLNRLVALKMIRGGAGSNAAHRERFRGEALAVARLRHPNIVQVYEVGEYQDQPFIALELAGGGNLARRLDKKPKPPAEAATLVETLARAMQHAHEAGVVHRDLKPSNVLLDGDGTVKVGDFGLARLLDEAGQTLTGQILGTPSYMAPEQAAGQTKLIGPLTDVYALGAILYEMLTGRPPFQSADTHNTLQQVRTQEPIPPSQLVPNVPRDLETVCLKCLEKEPPKRYASALALADDLRRFLDGRPVVARPVGIAGRLWRWARRKPSLAAATAVALGGLVIAVVTLSIAVFVVGESRDRAVGLADRNQRLADDNRGLAEAQGQLAGQYKDLAEQKEKERKSAERRAVEVLFADAYNRGETQDAAHGMLLLARVLPEAVRAETPDLERSIRVHLAGMSNHLHQVRAELAVDSPILKGAIFSPDGRLVLTLGGGIRLWDADTGKPRGVLAHPKGVRCAAFSPDGQCLVTGSPDGMVRLWDVGTGKQVGEPWMHPRSVDSVAVSPDGKIVLTICTSAAQLWSAETAKPVSEPFLNPNGHLVAAFSPDSRILITGKTSGPLQIWDGATAKPLRDPIPYDDELNSITFAPDGATFATTGRKSLRLWDTATLRFLDMPAIQFGQISRLAFSPDGRLLLSGSFDGTAQLRDARARSVGPPLRHDFGVEAVAFSPDGKTLATAASDHTARLWNADTLAPLGPPLRHPDPAVFAVAFSPDGRTLLTACNNGGGKAYLWDVEPRRRLGRPLLHNGRVEAVAFSPDGRLALTSALALTEPSRRGLPAEVRLWDLHSGQLIGPPLPQSSLVTRVAFLHDGKEFLTVGREAVQFWDLTTRAPLAPAIKGKEFITASALSSDDKLLMTTHVTFVGSGFQLWDTATKKAVGPFQRTDSPVQAGAFNPDSKLLLVGQVDQKAARLWDVASLKPLGDLPMHRGQIAAVAFSHDGRWFLTGEMLGDNVARLWDLERRQVVGPPLTHRGAILVVAFSPDDQTILTASSDGTARLWERATGRALGPAFQHGRDVKAATFSPDGRKVLTGSWDGTAKLWAVPQPVPGDPERVRLWAEVQTGLELDEYGGVKALAQAAWLERRRKLGDFDAGQ